MSFQTCKIIYDEIRELSAQEIFAAIQQSSYHMQGPER